jgi:general secretion pathway protein G
MLIAAMRRSLTLRRAADGGFTFIELIVAAALMMILASAALPLARVSMKRAREAELRRSLREVRLAVDTFHDWAEAGRLSQFELTAGNENYPTSLDQLVQGVTLANDVTGRKKKFLRRIPIDPMTGKAEWGMRSVQDPPDSKAWGGQNVYDIYTKYDGVALDGTKYKDW